MLLRFASHACNNHVIILVHYHSYLGILLFCFLFLKLWFWISIFRLVMASVQPQDVNKQLFCAVCLAQFKEPKVLPCLHNYCKECLAKLVKKKGAHHVITCPECRQDVKVSGKPLF